jgi:hypothetical protein
MAEVLYPEEREEWQWEAHYTDGSVLLQEGHKFKDIEQDRLHTFHMVHKELEPIIILWRPGLKLIHFYRTVIKQTASSIIKRRLYCFGYQDNTSKTILMIMPDGGIVVTDNINKVKVNI